MLNSLFSHRSFLLSASALAGTLLLTACGGGKSGSPEAAISPSAGGSAASSGALVSGVSSASAASTELPGTLAPVAEALGNMDQQQATMAFALASTNTTDAPAGISYYVDSRIGDDSNDGKSATVGTGGSGPWKTLGRIMKATLAAGDSLRLVCGSLWGETLKLPASGISGKPVIVTSYPGSCSNPPVIDGGEAVGNSSWAPYSGSIYRTPMDKEPLQLTSANGSMKLAHHPNRGADSAIPSSLYLRTAADSDVVIGTNGQTGSSYLVAGSDLPPKLAAGTKIRIRSSSWILDESTVASVSGSRINLVTPTTYPVKAGWGYFVVGQSWMLDSPGEWYYDANAKMLYAWMPDSGIPRNVVSTQLAAGIDLTSRKYVTMNNIIVKQVGTGISMPGATGVVAQYMSIRDTAAVGIDAVRGVSNTVTYTSLIRTGRDAISAADATGMKVLNNTVNQSGVLIAGDVITSLPVRSYAAIRPGLQSQVSANTVIDSGYHGIWPGEGSIVSGNYINGACSVLDDCAGIYVSQPNHNGVIRGNFVEHSRGAIEGKSTTVPARTQAQGIYLDEGASGVTVDSNTVIDTDSGIQLHIANSNIIKNNKLYGNRNNQLWLQETSNRTRVTGDLFGNTISSNQLVPTTPTSRGFLLETMIKNSELFAQLDWNRYFDRVYTRIGSDSGPATTADYTLQDWKSAIKIDGTPRNQDPNGTGASEVKLASWVISGAEIVPNGDLAGSLKGWTAYNSGAAQGTLTREACQGGYCARYVAGGTVGLVSTPNFSVIAGKWYRVSVDLMGGRDAQPVNLLVRRGGGGKLNSYEPLMAASRTVMVAKTMKRFSFTFQATQSVTAADPITGDLGARLDMQQIQPGDTVLIANASMVPISAATISTRTDILKNTSLVSVQASCPVGSSAPALCSSYARMSDDAPVTWPYTLAPRSSEVVYTRDASLVDGDGDGIADSQDKCPSTVKGLHVNANGCAIGQ